MSMTRGSMTSARSNNSSPMTRVKVGPWELWRGYDAFPSLGYCQHDSVYYEAGMLHAYILRGYYPQSGREVVDYLTASL